VQDPAELFEVKTVLLTVTLASMIIALLMPVVLRFGLLGVVVFLGAFQVVGVVLFVALEFFGIRSGARLFFGTIERGVVALYSGLGQAGPIVETAVIVSISVWLSFRLSVVLAERRDL